MNRIGSRANSNNNRNPIYRKKSLYIILLIILFIFYFVHDFSERKMIIGILVEKDTVEGNLALAKINDQSLLTDIALEAMDSRIKYMAFKKLTDQKFISKVFLKSNYTIADENEIKLAADLITDQTLLIRIAKNSPDNVVRNIAINKIKDKKVITKLAKTNKYDDVRISAIKRITDPKLLLKIALKDNSFDVCTTALNLLRDQALLEEIAYKSDENAVRAFAVGKLTNQELLFKIALGLQDSKDSIDETIRIAAIDTLTDQKLLIKVALELSSYAYRRSALYRVTDQTLLEKMAYEKGNTEILLQYKFTVASKVIPKKHQDRILRDSWEMITLLNDPILKNETGEIESVRFDWCEIARTYVSEDIYKERMNMDGENLKCSIKFKKQAQPITYSWSSKFPEKTSGIGFLKAEIRYSDLFDSILKSLSELSLLRISKNTENIYIRDAAQDQVALLSISKP